MSSWPPWELNRDLGVVETKVTYQDSCHLAHGQRIRIPPRKLLGAIPGVEFREMALRSVLRQRRSTMWSTTSWRCRCSKRRCKPSTPPGRLDSDGESRMSLQLRAGVDLYGRGQKVTHVVELLDESYHASGSRFCASAGGRP